MIVNVWLNGESSMRVEAENKSVGSIAEIAAAQTDQHREGDWTLALKGEALDPELQASIAGLTEDCFVDLIKVPHLGLFRRILARMGM